MTEKINFKIIEDPTPDYEEKFDEFINLYNAGIYKVAAIKNMLEWNQGTYNRAYKHAKKEGLLNQSNLMKPVKDIAFKGGPKYYTKQGNRYVIARVVKGKRIYYASFKTEVEARLGVSYFKEYDWDKSKSWEIRAKVRNDILALKAGDL